MSLSNRCGFYSRRDVNRTSDLHAMGPLEYVYILRYNSYPGPIGAH